MSNSRTVFVVMGNDYPDKVFLTEAEADAYCAKKTEENAAAMKNGPSGRIYWRWYSFNLEDEALKETRRHLAQMLEVYCRKGNEHPEPKLIRDAWQCLAPAGEWVVPITAVEAGTEVICDDGFTCITPFSIKTVRCKNGEFFIPCQDGEHDLEGQLDDEERYVGLIKL